MGRWLGAVLALLALVWVWLVDNYIPEVPTEGEPGPRAFPFLLGILFGLLGIAMALAPAVREPSPGADDIDQAARDTANRREWSVALATFAMLIGHAFFLDKLGFLLSTFLLTAVATVGILRLRTAWLVAAFGIGLSAISWLVFRSMLGIPLPGGSWIGWPQ